MNTPDLLRKWSTSYFASRDFLEAPSFASRAEVLEALDDYNDDPGAALLTNVEQARSDVRETSERCRQATYDGLLDKGIYATASKEQQRAWRICVDIVRGDYSRAVAELAHWRGYVAQHLAGTLPPARMVSVRVLAESKAMRTDSDSPIPF